MKHDFEPGANRVAPTARRPYAEVPLTRDGGLDWLGHFSRERVRQERAIRMEERRKERARIARELDRRLFERFSGVSMLVDGAVGEMPADGPFKAAANRTLLLIRRVIAEGQQTLAGMGLSDLRAASLECALAEIADEIAPGGAKVRICVLGRTRDLPSAISDEVYLVAREALVNALRHSEATSIEVEVEYLTGRLRLVVRDNGIGIDREVLQREPEFHWGLKGMRERAASIGAQLRILSRAAAGTEVEVSVATDLVYTYAPVSGRANLPSSAPA
jgi:signal transduction histidine kinase